MAKLIDINNDDFWQILFDEACVEGKQAERIEKELKKFSIDEQEIRNHAINEFAELIKNKFKEAKLGGRADAGVEARNIVDEIAKSMKGEKE